MKVLIVGAGPAGVTLALLLARRNIRVTLLERETDFARVFRGEALMPLGIDALYQMGLGGVLSQLPTRNVESWNFYIDAQHLFQVYEPQEALAIWLYALSLNPRSSNVCCGSEPVSVLLLQIGYDRARPAL